MGAGICAMHYTGMAALRAQVEISHDPLFVALSYLVSAGASIGALVAAARDRTALGGLAAAAALGLAIVGMHYTGMAGLRLEYTGAHHAGHATSSLSPILLAVGVAAGTLVLLLMTAAAAGLGRQFEVLAAREAETLRRSRAELQAVLTQMPMAVMVAEAPSGRITFGNDEAARLLGAGGDLSPHALDEGEPSPEDPLLRALAGEPVNRERWERRDDRDRIVILEISAGPVRGPDGEILMAVMAAQDVTAQLEAEEALHQAQKLEGLGQLTGGVAHDFNNLLTAVLGSLEMAARRVDDERALRLIANAGEAARRGARLTGQLLAFSRRQRLQTIAVDVNALIRRMDDDLLSHTLGGKVAIRLNLAADLPPTLADPVQLEMALLNLAINARDAMPDGGTLIFSTREVSVDTAGGPHDPAPGDYVAVTVADDGEGMAAAVMARAVEPFFTTKAVGKGSGLGLSQVAGLAKQLDGGMSIRSAPGQGTAVTLFLPRAARLALAVEAPAREVGSGGRMGSVLVVDDDDDVRRYVGELLAEAGHAVTTSDGGAEALARLAAGAEADVLLVDYAMPGMNGAEVIRKARAMRPDLPALIMSGYLDPAALPDELHEQQVLQKPFESDQLLERVAGLMAARQA
jgi:PAS domain S-box-containing protein